MIPETKYHLILVMKTWISGLQLKCTKSKLLGEKSDYLCVNNDIG